MLPQLAPAQAAAAPCETVADWWPRHRSIAATHPDPIHQAIVGGFVADRVAWAFASGYQAALRALVPGLPADRVCAFCVTEEDGSTPRAIRTTVRRIAGGFALDGAKKWTTLGPDGGFFLVAARDGDAAGERPSLRMVALDAGARGLTVTAMPPTRFVPEVPHARLAFEKVEVGSAAILPGDGYDQYVKPFRTVEDIHVQAAVLAYLMRESQRLGWPTGWRERLAAVLAAFNQVANMPAASAETHIALAGALALADDLIEEAEAFWTASAADPAALRWRRDREILKVAGKAREQRTLRAWETLTAAPD